jgi:hypothetical protein
MFFPAKDSFAIYGVPAGVVMVTFEPKSPDYRVVKVLYEDKDIKDKVFPVSEGQEINGVKIVLARVAATSGPAASSPAVREPSSQEHATQKAAP